MPVKEGEELQLTCIITGHPVVVQYTRDTTPIVYWITNDGRCDQIQITNRTIYSASCDRLNNKYIMDILNVSKSFNNRSITCEAQFHTFESHKVYDRILIAIGRERKNVYDRILIEVNLERKYYNTFEYHEVYDRMHIDLGQERECHTFESHKVYDRIHIVHGQELS
jgi:hypothetical protein